MEDIAVLIKKTLETHKETAEGCWGCVNEEAPDEWPCGPYRIASDWTRQREDLRRTWRNKSFIEVYTNRKYLCCMCSKAETGLVCDDCISEADEEITSAN